MATAEMHSENSVDLSKQFLLAMPGMVGGEWANTVIFMCEHNAQGALGLVVNRPTDLMLPDLLQRLSITVSRKSAWRWATRLLAMPVRERLLPLNAVICVSTRSES